MSCGISSCKHPKFGPTGKKNWACAFWRQQQEIINEELNERNVIEAKDKEALCFVEFSVEKLLEKRSTIKKTGLEFNVNKFLEDKPIQNKTELIDDYNAKVDEVKNKDPKLTIFDRIKNHSVPRCDDPRIEESLKVAHDGLKEIINSIDITGKDDSFSKITDKVEAIVEKITTIEENFTQVDEIIKSKVNDQVANSYLFDKFDHLVCDKEYLFQIIKIIELNPQLKKIMENSQHLTMIERSVSNYKWIVVPDPNQRAYLLKFFPNIFKDEAILYNQVNNLQEFMRTRKIIYVASNYDFYDSIKDKFKNILIQSVVVGVRGEDMFELFKEKYKDRKYVVIFYHFFVFLDIFKYFKTKQKGLVFGSFVSKRRKFIPNKGFSNTFESLGKEKIRIVPFSQFIEGNLDYEIIK